MVNSKDYEDTYILSDSVAFNGGTWYRRGNQIVIKRKLYASDIPPGFHNQKMKLLATYPTSCGREEQAIYEVEGWSTSQVIKTHNEVEIRVNGKLATFNLPYEADVDWNMVIKPLLLKP